MKEAIIFIPGIKATALANMNSFHFDLVYENYDTLGASIASSVMGVRLDEQLHENPKYDLNPEKIIERNHIMSYPYRNSINDISAKTKKAVYLFGYDWRKSNTYNAQLLSDFINSLKEKLGKISFDFITHSMGAMIMSCHLKNLNENYSEINKIIFTAPPFQGAIEALKHMALGNGGLRGFFHADEGSRKAIRTYPAIYELCPWYPDAVKEGGTPIDLTLKEHWQESIWDDIELMFDKRIDMMINFRRNDLMDLNKLPDDLKDKCLIIAGTGTDTLQKINLINKPHREKYFDFKDAVLSDEGDCTVPLSSSTIYQNTIKTITVKKGNIFNEGLSTINYHALFLTDSRVKNIINRFLMDKTKTADWYKSIASDNEINLL